MLCSKLLLLTIMVANELIIVLPLKPYDFTYYVRVPNDNFWSYLFGMRDWYRWEPHHIGSIWERFNESSQAGFYESTYGAFATNYHYVHDAAFDVPIYVLRGMPVPPNLELRKEYKRATDWADSTFPGNDRSILYPDSVCNADANVDDWTLYQRVLFTYQPAVWPTRSSVINFYKTFAIIDFISHMCQCRKLHEGSLENRKKLFNTSMFIDHCPNPCYKPGRCSFERHTNGACLMIRTERNPKVPSNVREFYSSIYDFDYKCGCQLGYTFNQQTHQCEEKHKDQPCEYNRCRNYGQCIPTSPQGTVELRHYSCRCRPAWTGHYCDIPRNPCDLYHKLCGHFRCVRDPDSQKFGYTCQCPTGTEPNRKRTTCVNINECLLFDQICMNGGRCIDMDPLTTYQEGYLMRFKCECPRGFNGNYCERPPLVVTWSAWGPWSECSVYCGEGRQWRQRECPISGWCLGAQRHYRDCLGKRGRCNLLGPYANQSGYELVASWGLDWTDDDRLLDDALSTIEGWLVAFTSKLGRPSSRAFNFTAADYPWYELPRDAMEWTIEDVYYYYLFIFSFIFALLLVPTIVSVWFILRVIQELRYVD